MKKIHYIQPKMETMVLPKGILMGDPLTLGGSPTGPKVGGAPERREKAF